MHIYGFPVRTYSASIKLTSLRDNLYYNRFLAHINQQKNPIYVNSVFVVLLGFIAEANLLQN